MQEMLDLEEQLDIFAPVQAVLRLGFGWSEDSELALPVAEHVRFYADDGRHLADFEVQLVGQ